MSKSLLKLLDKSLFPASVMVLSKFLGILFVIQLFGIPLSIRDYSTNIFASTTVLRPEDIQTVTSYSDLIMYTVMAIFFSVTIFRAFFLHNTHVNPKTVLSLANRNLLNLIKDSYEIYHVSAAWWLFTALANVVIVFDVVANRTYAWIGIAATLFTALLSAIILQDVYKEVTNIKKHPGSYKWN